MRNSNPGTGTVRTVVHEGDGLKISYIRQPDARVLVFSFTERGNFELSGDGFGGDFLLGNGFDVVAIKSARSSWFEEVAPVLPRIHAALDQAAVRYDLRVCYGSSMGGHGAMRYAAALGANRVIAISPLFDIRDPADTRYAEDIRLLTSDPMIRADGFSPGCDYVVLYDPRGPDAPHVARFGAVVAPGRLRPVRLPYSGHPSGYFLAQTGLLKPVVEALIRGGALPKLRGPAVARRRSSVYLYCLADGCLRANKPGWAAALLDTALDRAPRDAELLALKSRALTGLRDWDGAEAAARAAMAADAGNGHRQMLLVDVLTARGALPAALAVLDKMIGEAPGVGHYAWLRQEVAARISAAAGVQPQYWAT